MTFEEIQKKKEYHKNYSKEWKKNNRDKYNTTVRKWQTENREKVHEYSRKYYNANREKEIIRCMKSNKKRYKKLRLQALTHYSGGEPKCACCGETIINFLSIDHINGGGGQHRKELKLKNMKIAEFLYKENYPSGYRILCYNCNMSYGFYGFCPHQGEQIIEKAI